jgi:hypothetical protein
LGEVRVLFVNVSVKARVAKVDVALGNVKTAALELPPWVMTALVARPDPSSLRVIVSPV